MLTHLAVFALSMASASAELNRYTRDAHEAREGKCKPKYPEWPQPSDSPLNIFPHAAVASDNGLCAEAGRNIMMQGGNAIDAIVATCLCQGATNSHASGLAGGFFMTIYNRTTQKCIAIDAREVAGVNANQNMYNTTVNPGVPDDASKNGFLAIAVPGELHGLRTAWEMFGKAPWEDLFTVAIDFAENGFPASGSLAQIAMTEEKFLKDPSTGLDVFVNPETGETVKEGEIVKRPLLAKTLKALAISKDPIKLFYEGIIGKSILQDIKKGGGILVEKDLANYKAKVYETPVTAKVGDDITLCGPPPPSSAAVIIAILKILSQFNLSQKDLESVESGSQAYHYLVEAYKYAYGARSVLGDPAFVPTVDAVVGNMTSDKWAKQIKNLITEVARTQPDYGYKPYDVEDDHGTSHINSVDKDGNAVAMTTTVNHFFGSKRRSLVNGMIYNNQMDDFSSPGYINAYGFPASPENYISPGKRPRSSMSPFVIYNHKTGDVRLAAGGAGGSRIISSVSYVAARVLFFNETVKEAVDAPRLHNQLFPFHTEYELVFPEAYRFALGQGKHKQNMTEDQAWESSIVTAIEGVDGKWRANSDYRKGGAYPAGF